MKLSMAIAALVILLAGSADAGSVVLDNGDKVSGKILRT